MYIIADIGSNCSTRNEARESIYAAKKAGADCVKFQCFSEFDLYGEGDTIRLVAPWLEELATYCDTLGVDFGCSVFSPDALPMVNPYVKAHKIASSCVTHTPLLEAIAACGKPVFMSIGAATTEEIQAALAVLSAVNVQCLYCNAAYPTRYADLRHLVGTGIGFSDHSTQIMLPAMAAMCGAPVIEKHFTAFPERNTPDRPHSLTQEEFHTMVRAIKEPPTIGPTPEETDFVNYHKVRKTERGYYRIRK